MALDQMGNSISSPYQIYKFSKGDCAMGEFMNIWDEFLAFMDRVVQWLKFVFTGEIDSADGEWPPKDYPDINA